jgi:SPP1 gp7 family putative phage head morphogenesis protein
MATAPPQLIEQTTRHQLFVEGYKTHEAKDLLEALRSIEAGLVGRLSRSNISEWTRARLEGQLESYQELLREGYQGNLLPALNNKLAEFGVYEAGFEARSLAQVAPTYNFALPTPGQIRAATLSTPLSVRGLDNGALLEPFLDGWTARQIEAVTNAIRAGAIQGQTTAQIITGLNDTVFPLGERSLAGVVRTTLQHTSSVAREQTWERNSDIVKRVRWTSTLDSRTCEICAPMDGRTFKLSEGPRPPLHPNCRCATVAVLDDRFAFLEDGATRSARDPETGRVESVSAKETYYSWLKKQPAQVQDAAIGPTRGKLLRDGGLSSQRFSELQLSKTFRPLTLSEMQDLDPVAFIKAGVYND